MYLFNESELNELSRRYAQGNFKSQRRAGYLKDHEPVITKDGIADWSMYYRCPEDSAPLTFNISSPHSHVCSVCGKAVSGPHYDGAWWCKIHNDNADTAYYSAFAYLVSHDPDDLALVRQILNAYAAYYPDYPPHGDIPYNDQGKLFAQTLDEAVFLRKLSYAYDIIADHISAGERSAITQNLFRTGAEFLAGHCGNQIHNHEVLIRSQIGVLGLILNDETLIDFALKEKYGLLYQLDHGVLPDGLWFEGSLSYHQYALAAFMAYEIFARHTGYSNLDNPKYRNMIRKIADFINEDGTLPSLNDHCGVKQHVAPDLATEFGYQYYHDEDMLRILNTAYLFQERNNMEAFFFGATQLEKTADTSPDGPSLYSARSLPLVSYHDCQGSGITIFRGPHRRRLILKHAPFGGEHDHYDRLGVEFSAFGEVDCLDLGTVPYGAIHHYGYFKNSASHNTVTINGKNHPPALCSVNDFKATETECYISASADFSEKVPVPDSFVIRQWDPDTYRSVKMNRQILWTEHYWIDVFTVCNPEGFPADWSLGIDGTLASSPEYAVPSAFVWPDEPPYGYMKDVRKYITEDMDIARLDFACGSSHLQMFCCCNGKELLSAKAPNNPPSRTLQKVILRSREKRIVFISVMEAYKESPTVHTVEAEVSDDMTEAVVSVNGKKYAFHSAI